MVLSDVSQLLLSSYLLIVNGDIPIFCSAISHAWLSIQKFSCSPHASCLLQSVTPAVHSPCPCGISISLFLYAVQLITAGFIIECVASFNVITFIASLLRGTTQENMTSQRERTVGEMT